MGRGLLSGIADHDKKMSQVHNSDHEFTVLRRFPFHEAMTRPAVMQMHSNAVRLLFEIVPEEYQLAVLGRFNRKLVKRMQQLKNEGIQNAKQR